MIIEVNQTKSNLACKFAVYYDNTLKYYGEQSALTSMRSNSLLRLNGSMALKTKYTTISFLKKSVGLLAFLILGSSASAMNAAITNVPLKIAAIGLVFFVFIFFDYRKKKLNIYKVLDEDDGETAEFSCYRAGFLDSCYLIEINDRKLKVYSISKSSYQYLPIYMEDKQIGQINKLLHVTNNKDNYILYLLDGHKQLAELLSLFVIYFDNIEYGRRGEVYIGKKKTWKWTYSKSNSFFDSTWVQANFGAEQAGKEV